MMINDARMSSERTLCERIGKETFLNYIINSLSKSKKKNRLAEALTVEIFSRFVVISQRKEEKERRLWEKTLKQTSILFLSSPEGSSLSERPIFPLLPSQGRSAGNRQLTSDLEACFSREILFFSVDPLAASHFSEG